jgi:hypothetical protein
VTPERVIADIVDDLLDMRLDSAHVILSLSACVLQPGLQGSRLEASREVHVKCPVGESSDSDLPCARANPAPGPTCPIVDKRAEESCWESSLRNRAGIVSTKLSFCFQR